MIANEKGMVAMYIDGTFDDVKELFLLYPCSITEFCVGGTTKGKKVLLLFVAFLLLPEEYLFLIKRLVNREM